MLAFFAADAARTMLDRHEINSTELQGCIFLVPDYVSPLEERSLLTELNSSKARWHQVALLPCFCYIQLGFFSNELPKRLFSAHTPATEIIPDLPGPVLWLWPIAAAKGPAHVRHESAQATLRQTQVRCRENGLRHPWCRFHHANSARRCRGGGCRRWGAPSRRAVCCPLRCRPGCRASRRGLLAIRRRGVRQRSPITCWSTRMSLGWAFR